MTPHAWLRGVAILAGGGCDALASFLLNVATSLILSHADYLPLHLVPRFVFQEPVWVLLLIALRLPFSVLGGFIAGRLANSLPFQHALLAGLAATCARILLQVVNPSSVPMWLRAVGVLSTLAMAGLGGILSSFVQSKTAHTPA